jgi:hypothetical protein
VVLASVDAPSVLHNKPLHLTATSFSARAALLYTGRGSIARGRSLSRVPLAGSSTISMIGIDNSEIVTRIFGRWPSFHDAEVVRVLLERPPEGVRLEAQLRVWEMTPDLDPSGHFIRKNETLVTLQFLGVHLGCFEGFNTQNVIASLDVSTIAPEEHEGRRLLVQMPSLYGLDAEFECERAIVLAAEPYSAAG